MDNTAPGSGVAAITLSKRTNILTLNIAITSMAREDTLSGRGPARSGIKEINPEILRMRLSERISDSPTRITLGSTTMIKRNMKKWNSIDPNLKKGLFKRHSALMGSKKLWKEIMKSAFYKLSSLSMRRKNLSLKISRQELCFLMEFGQQWRCYTHQFKLRSGNQLRKMTFLGSKDARPSSWIVRMDSTRSSSLWSHSQ